MDWSALPLLTLRLLLVLGGQLLPGWLLLRTLTLPRTLGLSFLLSASVLYLTVVALALLHAPLGLATLALGPGLVCAGALLTSRLRPAPAPVLTPAPARAWGRELGPWLAGLLVLGGILAFRLSVEPLSGPDVRFRWSYLAEQMLRYHTLDFYPAQTAADFVRYFWPESIPPGIASLYAWSYAAGGGTDALWTSPAVALQLLALFEFVWTLAEASGGRHAARIAVVLVAACPLLLWSYLLGQETGLLATAVVALVWSLDRLAVTGERRWLIPATAAALVAASTREYGFAFGLVAVAKTWTSSRLRPQAAYFSLLVLPGIACWPLYCWLRTGNPLFSLEVYGLFPVNPVFTAANRALLAGQQACLHSTDDWLALGRYLVLWALPAVVGLVSLVRLRLDRRADLRLLTTLAALSIGLWFLSVNRTAGGLFYSLRVLSPAFALLAVAGGVGLGGIQAPRFARILALLLLALLLESLPKTLTLPANSYRLPFSDWAGASREIGAGFHVAESDMTRQLAAVPPAQRIVGDNFDLPRLAATVNRTVEPLWTPDFAWFFDQTATPEETARRWRESGIHVLIVGRTGTTLPFLLQSGRWNTPGYQLQTTGGTATHLFLTFVPAQASRSGL